ncbi:bifunctional phosphopantothenoylcysteine decarboxylase/phosphopantothenate synthase [Parasphingorhabdus flavimaris]|uniref:Coenzyme A biosynthesis bifunctional protein CoaBC n=1 Tax=Parasphingorhabdus flavimaris TaxID=266812 RepID=A0ABX2N3P6_9SPHN|nr:bifunctional phosphopantothenoylcysteine decarboxylase/phosphopantothenate synthase [Parasphingorhabdus flavimaris]NVD28181.1 bifunctional phosphopantothenoylcysteine decarboxylase/phosphopantothenate synthase [Parasphingorhabdus flavimaris]|tara:strand:- start:1911 stop:3188 length:1278 start_codon:yes stop_codon:yes gene_type:complete
MTKPKHILLVIGGGIAAYKTSELIRLIKKSGMTVRCVLTESGAQFVTPMTLAALSENEVHTTLWSLKDEAEMGHIQLSREADLLVICPATANLLAKMAGGVADDLATTLLLATDTPVMAVPAMNVRMWLHAATQRNIKQLRADGIFVMHPDEGDMACGEFGPGRLPDPEAIMAEISVQLEASFTTTDGATKSEPGNRANILDGQPAFAPDRHRPLRGKHVLITAGPTHEPIDPVRYIANRSSGRQGFALAAAAAEAGAQVTLVAGPVHLSTPAGVIRVDVETALEMEKAVHDALPADIAIMVAAVADWRADSQSGQKIKKKGAAPEPLKLTENPDILAGLARHEQRPGLLIGFAAETQKIVQHAQAKLAKKGCDWIVANDVSGDVMGGANNSVQIITATGSENWEQLPKPEVARRLVAKIIEEIA